MFWIGLILGMAYILIGGTILVVTDKWYRYNQFIDRLACHPVGIQVIILLWPLALLVSSRGWSR